MKYMLRVFTLLGLWFYLTLLLAWWGTKALFGDSIWWLGLLNSFVPFFFAPLLILIPIAPMIRHPIYNVGLLIPTALLLVNYGTLFLLKPALPHRLMPAPLTIMTFNIRSGSDSQQTIDVIRENGLPDIVALQETNRLRSRLIREEFDTTYPHQLYEHTLSGKGISLLSRFVLEPVRSEMLIDLSCRIYRVTIDPNHSFRLYNCHPHSSNLGNFLGDGFPLARQINETFWLRYQLNLALVKEIADYNEPTIVVGDFNSTDQSEAYKILQDVLFDAHRQIGWGWGHTFPTRGNTFQDVPILPRLVRIDMVWYTAAFVALQSQVSMSHGESDHHPLVVTLGWRDSQP